MRNAGAAGPDGAGQPELGMSEQRAATPASDVCDGWCWWPSTNRCILVAVTTITVVNGNSVVIDNSYCDCLPIAVIGPV